MILPLAFAIITLIFVLYSIFLKNETYKKFFFLLSMLFVIITFASFYAKENEICVEFSTSTGECIAWQRTLNFGGTEALIYGFGLLFLTFIALVALEIITKSLKMAIS